MVGQCAEFVADVLMEQVPRAKANERKQYCLQGFVRRDQHDPFIAFCSRLNICG